MWFSAHLHCKYVAIIEHAQNSDERDAASEDQENKLETQTQTQTGDDMFDGGHVAKDPAELDLALDEAPAATDGKTHGIATTSDPNEMDLELDDDLEEKAPDASKLPSSLQDARARLPASFHRLPTPPLPPPQQYKPVKRPENIANTVTDFLALDKCMPHRDFLQLLSVSSADAGTTLDERRPLELEYDKEWLAITRMFALQEPLTLGGSDARVPPPKSQVEYEKLVDEQLSWIDTELGPEVNLRVPQNFIITAPVYDGGDWRLPQYSQTHEYPNPQTQAFCDMLKIPNAFAIGEEDRAARMAAGPRIDTVSERFRGPSRGRGHLGKGGRGRGRGGRGIVGGRGKGGIGKGH
nr:lariat debranching enzyme [Quercus suber]